MWKSFGSSFAALVVIYLAGIVTQSSGFSIGVVALFSISSGLMGYAFTSNAKWHTAKIAKENEVKLIWGTLDSSKVYEVHGNMAVEGTAIIDLTDVESRKRGIAKIYSIKSIFNPYPPIGFREEKIDERIFLIPVGKKFVVGKSEETVFVPEPPKPDDGCGFISSRFS